MDCILVKSKDSVELEVDLESDGTVSLETLRNFFGTFVNALTYKNPTTGRDRIVPVSSVSFREPNGGWGDRVYTVTSGDTTVSNSSNVSLSTSQDLRVKKEKYNPHDQLSQGIQAHSTSCLRSIHLDKSIHVFL